MSRFHFDPFYLVLAIAALYFFSWTFGPAIRERWKLARLKGERDLWFRQHAGRVPALSPEFLHCGDPAGDDWDLKPSEVDEMRAHLVAQFRGLPKEVKELRTKLLEQIDHNSKLHQRAVDADLRADAAKDFLRRLNENVVDFIGDTKARSL